MRVALLVVALAVHTGCMTDPVLLRHPQTGKTAKCGPYPMTTGATKIASVAQERGCIEDYQRQGCERVME